ncbi:hypothetical protein ACQ3IE_004994 [Escherichia coli]
MNAKIRYGLSAAVLALIAAGAPAPDILDQFLDEKEGNHTTAYRDGAGNGPAVADEFDNPTTDIRKDRCSKCMRGCELRRNVGNFGGFLSINKLSQ